MDTLLVLRRPLAPPAPAHLKIKCSAKKRKRRTTTRSDDKVARELTTAGEGDVTDSPATPPPEPVCFVELYRAALQARAPAAAAGSARARAASARGDHAPGATTEIVLEIPYGDSAEQILNVPEFTT